MSDTKEQSFKRKMVLFIGSADTEGVTAQLRAVGTYYKRKMLESKPENWEAIVGLFREYEVSSVVVKLTIPSFYVLSDPNYSEVRERLLKEVSSKPNLFLVHESILAGQHREYNGDEIDSGHEFQEPQYEVYTDFVPPPAEVRQEVLDLLSSYGFEVIPYKKNVELVVLASSFVERHESNLIFRMYIPSERMWANEAEKLFQLFRDYLQKVSGLDVRHEQYRTSQGLIYEIYGGGEVDSSQLPAKFSEFSSFMEMCASNPQAAHKLLASSHLSNAEVFNIVERYSKEARRLNIDIRQERERRLLSIKHGLETELIEYVRTDEDWAVVNQLIEGSVPSANSVLSSLSIDRRPARDVAANITVNINPQIIGKVQGVVAQQILGDQHLGPDAKQLLDAIEEFAGDRKAVLASAVHELSDKSARQEDRIAAKQRLKGFVYTVAGKLGDVAAGVLQSYIENKIGL